MPKRIQRQRTKGWKMPAGAIYVGGPTKFGNPFFDTDKARAVARYRVYLVHKMREGRFRQAVWDLRGHDLACWCPLSEPCHADVLLEIANAS